MAAGGPEPVVLVIPTEFEAPEAIRCGSNLMLQELYGTMAWMAVEISARREFVIAHCMETDAMIKRLMALRKEIETHLAEKKRNGEEAFDIPEVLVSALDSI